MTMASRSHERTCNPGASLNQIASWTLAKNISIERIDPWK